MKPSSLRRKNIQMVATMIATATYAAGFNPPGGVWQEDTAGHLPGDPIMRSTNHHRYLVFFYFNAAAFALSLMVVVATLILAGSPKKTGQRYDLLPLLLMVGAMVAFTVAYGMGACRDKFSVVAFSVGAAINTPACLVQLCLVFRPLPDDELKGDEKYNNKLIAPLSMFGLAVSYVGGLSTPGGFWDNAEGGHRPGDSILHGRILHVFFYCNAAQFVSSVHGVFLLICGGNMYFWLAVFNLIGGTLGLIVAYTIGSSRGHRATVGVICSLCAAVLGYAGIHMAARWHVSSCVFKLGSRFFDLYTRELEGMSVTTARDRGASLVQLLAGLAVSVTYTAGMYPPGGVWQDGDKAGDPILLTTNPGRYRAFYYCNSVAFVASLVAILLAQKRFRYLTDHHALQAAMILDLLALIVAYAIGSCRDQLSTMYVLGIAGAAVVYVVIHVQYFTLGSSSADKDEDAEKRGGRFLFFAILVASITYQAGLTPPGGFLLQDNGDHAGNPVLLYNYPRRYKAFFYCNSVSFMVSTVQLLLLVNPSMYKPAIRSHALSLCSAVSFLSLIGAFATGSTQHRKTSILFFVLAAVAVLFCLPVLLMKVFSYCRSDDDDNDRALQAQTEEGRRMEETQSKEVTQVHDNADRQALEETARMDDRHRKNIYLMTLGILVGSVTYQAGLDPPGGSWQSSSHAGHPVMHHNRYLVFLCGNSTSLVASIYLIEILLFSMSFSNLPEDMLPEDMDIPDMEGLEKAIEPMVVAQFLGFLVAYAAGASRQWKTSAHVVTLVIAVLAYMAIHLMLTFYIKKKPKGSGNSFQQQATTLAP